MKKVLKENGPLQHKEFIGDENGNLKALKMVDLEWKMTEDGKPAQFVEVPGSRKRNSL